MPHLPTPVRAYLGLVAKAIDDTRDLPTRLTELPVVAVTTGMKLSLRVQQQYTGLVSRGDDLLAGLRGGSDEAPGWATFDDDPADTDRSDTGSDSTGPDIDEIEADEHRLDDLDAGLGGAVEAGLGSPDPASEIDPDSDVEADRLAGLPPVRRASALRRTNLPRDRAPSAFDVADPTGDDPTGGS